MRTERSSRAILSFAVSKGSRLQPLRPDRRPPAQRSRRGILLDAMVSVVSVQWFGSEALELTYKTPAEKVANELVSAPHSTRAPVRSARCAARSPSETPMKIPVIRGLAHPVAGAETWVPSCWSTTFFDASRHPDGDSPSRAERSHRLGASPETPALLPRLPFGGPEILHPRKPACMQSRSPAGWISRCSCRPWYLR